MTPWQRQRLSTLLMVAKLAYWASKRLDALAGRLAAVVTREVVRLDLERTKDVLAVYEEHKR